MTNESPRAHNWDRKENDRKEYKKIEDKEDKKELTKVFGNLTVDALGISELPNKLKPFPSPLSFSPALPETTM